jgi:hypothetical protein
MCWRHQRYSQTCHSLSFVLLSSLGRASRRRGRTFVNAITVAFHNLQSSIQYLQKRRFFSPVPALGNQGRMRPTSYHFQTRQMRHIEDWGGCGCFTRCCCPTMMMASSPLLFEIPNAVWKMRHRVLMENVLTLTRSQN